jgi:hypothetical protein
MRGFLHHQNWWFFYTIFGENADWLEILVRVGDGNRGEGAS